MSGDIETERLLIRRFRLGDAAAFLPLVSAPDVLRYTGEQPLPSADEACKLLKERQLRDYELYGYGRMACIEKSSGRPVGSAASNISMTWGKPTWVTASCPKLGQGLRD